MKTARLLITAIMMIGISLSASAQDKIDRVIEQLERTDGVSVTYTEKRNPKTKKTYKSSKVITFTDVTMANRLMKAMKEERENAIEISQVNKSINMLKFGDNDTYTKYTLINDGKSWTITVVLRALKHYPADQLGMINLNDFNSLQSLESLESLEGLEGFDWMIAGATKN